LKGSAAETNSILFRRVFHRFHYIGLFHLAPPPLRGWCRRHLFNVVRKIDFGLLKVDPTGPRLPLGAALRREMRRQFGECLHARVPYEPGRRLRPAGRLRAARAWWCGH
jgi:hypothetical protein